jgi:hypothetical protein
MSDVTPRENFNAALKAEFAPALRVLGFKGSGQNFIRVSGEVINALNIQGSKFGDAAFVNLGLHFTFLAPCWTEEPRPIAKWREADCEFRVRLSTRPGFDFSWKYGATQSDALISARNISAVYCDLGESLFERFYDPLCVASAVSVEALERGDTQGFPWHVTKVRMALAMARINQRLGKPIEARRFAEFGLRNLGRAAAVRSVLEALANAT